MDTSDNFNEFNDNFSNISNTLGLNDSINNAFNDAEMDAVQGLSCINRQFNSLVILLIILYAWSNQNNNCYLMNTNSQLICNMSCLLDKLVDSAIENCENCKYCAPPNTSGTSGSKHKKRHRHRDCECGCDCGCDEC